MGDLYTLTDYSLSLSDRCLVTKIDWRMSEQFEMTTLEMRCLVLDPVGAQFAESLPNEYFEKQRVQR